MDYTLFNDEPSGSDLLNRAKLAEGLADVIRKCSPPFAVGLYGGWGTGKTTLMKLTQQYLSDSGDIKTVWFDPWFHQNDDFPVIALIQTLAMANGNSDEKIKKIVGVISVALGGIALKALTHMGIADIQKIGEQYENEVFATRAVRIRIRDKLDELIDIITENGRIRLVVFVDDLDRCLAKNAVAVLESIKLFLNNDKCVYVVGADKRAIENCITAQYGKEGIEGAGYLDKIIQLPLNVPPIGDEALSSYISELLPPSLKDRLTKVLTRCLDDNPRSVKRFVNTFLFNNALAARVIGESYDTEVMAGLLYIQYYRSEVYKVIVADEELRADLFGEKTKIREKFGDTIEDGRMGYALTLVGRAGVNSLDRYIYLSEATAHVETMFGVKVADAGNRKAEVVDILRRRTGCAIQEATELLNDLPCSVALGLPRPEAEQLVKELLQVGAAANIY